MIRQLTKKKPERKRENLTRLEHVLSHLYFMLSSFIVFIIRKLTFISIFR